jgi:thiamine kinase-like enzyme
VENPSYKNGVIGFFIFKDKNEIAGVPEKGEFVKFLSESGLRLMPYVMSGIREIRDFDEYKRYVATKSNSRFFNKVVIENERVTKSAISSEFAHLLNHEVSWYEFCRARHFPHIPEIYSTAPLTMSRIDGMHPWETAPSQRKFDFIIGALDELHELEEPVLFDREAAIMEYSQKTKDRLNRVKSVLHFGEHDEYMINGRRVSNPIKNDFDVIDSIAERITRGGGKFTVIHGDPTFSNMLINNSTNDVKLIDPRGYFYKTEIYGDPLYDYAKLYYSMAGNYDQFNRRNFTISINENEVKMQIASNGWEGMVPAFKKRLGASMDKIEALHALIWLSLTGYVLDDVDSILGSYFKGLMLLDEVMRSG